MDPERDRSRPEGPATRSLLDIIVTVAASAIIALMVAGGGAAVERMTSAHAWTTEPASFTPPLAWREPD